MGLAIKNNNPGNLRDVSTGSFRTFSTPQEGYAALLNDLDAKRSGHTSTGLSGTSTLADFASKYAPAGDNNDPAQYTANLANHMGVAPNTPLKDLDLNKWAQAVTTAEDKQNATALGFTGNTQVAAAGVAPIQAPANPAGGNQTYGSPLQPPQQPENPFGANSAYASDGSQHGSTGGIVSGVGNFLKGLVSAPATILARPFQAAAELAGASAEDVNKYNFGGLIAPVPQNAGDVAKDVGRGLETISYGIGGGAAATGVKGVLKGSLIQATKDAALQGTKAGAVAGLGSELEQNGANSTFNGMLTNTLGGAAIGGVTGGLIPAGGAIIKNVIPGLARGTAGLAGRAVQGAENATARAATVSAAPKAEAQAMRSGIGDDVINFVKSSNQSTKSSFQKMLDIHKAAVENPHPGALQAKQVPGQTFLKAVESIQSGSGKAAAKLKAIAAANPTKKVDIMPAINDYFKALSDRGITVGKAGTFKSTGNIPNSELKYYKDISKEIKSVLGRGTNTKLNATKVHQLRQRLFATLESATKQGGKPGERPFGDAVDQDVQVLRRSLSKIMGPEYQKAAESYAKNESVLRNVAKMAGTTIDQLSTKDRKLGEVLMRSLGNASDRPLALIQDTLDAAKRNGFKSQDDILAQLRFADILENAYGSTQTRSLGGQVARGVKEGAMDVASDLGTGNLLGAATKTVRALAGKSTDEQVKAFEGFIREQAGKSASKGTKGLVNPRVK
jgi:hypothetical protein